MSTRSIVILIQLGLLDLNTNTYNWGQLYQIRFSSPMTLRLITRLINQITVKLSGKI